MNIKIFVEGIADSKFLSDYILYKYGITLGINVIIITKGWTNLYSSGKDGEMVRNQMTKNTDDGGINLLIFDADKDFKLRLQKITEWQVKTKLKFESFLWPNHEDSGDLEAILEKIITQTNIPIFDCWEKYEICLRSKKIEGRTMPLTTPAKKTKIYGYLEALLGEVKSEKEKIKEKNRDYCNSEFWNLDSEELTPLKIFLDKYLIFDKAN